MSELTIQAVNFLIQPLANLRDGPAELRWWYSRSFLDSDGNQIQWGTGTTGFWVTTPCSIADGLVTVDLDTLLWTTDDAQDPNPASIFISAGLFSSRGQMYQQIQITGKAQWVVPSSLAPVTTWNSFSAYNQAVYLANPPVVFYTAAQTDGLVDRAFDEHPASDTELGTVLLTVPADIPATPVVWGANDPLVRDADKIQGVDVSPTAPMDTQALVFNQANNRYEPSNQAAGSGNVTSNEVVSVDGELVLMSGTGGKTIKKSTIVDDGINFDATGMRITAAEYDSDQANIATNGTIRLNKDDFIGWRDEVNGGNISLSKNVSDEIESSGGFAGNLTGDVTGTAGNLSGTPTLPNGTAAATQAPGDNTTKLATTAFVQAALPPGGGYTTVEDEGAPLTQRSTMNFVGAGVTASDDGSETVITIPGGGGSTSFAGIDKFSNL